MIDKPFKPRGVALKLSEGDRWQIVKADVAAAVLNTPARLRQYIRAVVRT